MSRPITSFEESYTLYTTVRNKGYNLLQHANGLVILTLNREHPFIQHVDAQMTDSPPILTCKYMVHPADGGSSHSQKQMRKESVKCKPDTVLLRFSVGKADSDTEIEHEIVACVPGNVLEINSSLEENPSLILREPTGAGYVAIINVNKRYFEQIHGESSEVEVEIVKKNLEDL